MIPINHKSLNENNHLQITRQNARLLYEGYIHKCPNCGEVLESLLAVCPSCGHEIRGVKANYSIREFMLNLAQAENDTQKISLIRSFPIPNTKEDVFEFLIMAATNFSADQSLSDNGIRKDVSDAWLTKIKQSYQNAKLLFAEEQDFPKIQNIYDQVCIQIRSCKQNVKRNTVANIALRTIGLWVGLMIFIIALISDYYFSCKHIRFPFGRGSSNDHWRIDDKT